MCDKENKFELVNFCQDSKVTSSGKCTVLVDLQNVDKVSEFMNNTNQELSNLQQQLEAEKEHGSRMQELYTCCLGYIMKCISEQNIGILDEAVKKLGEIEIKYIKK